MWDLAFVALTLILFATAAGTRARAGRSDAMTFETAVAFALAVLALIYLLYALLRAEEL